MVIGLPRLTHASHFLILAVADLCTPAPVHTVQVAKSLGLARHQPCKCSLQNVGDPVGSCDFESLAATTFPGTKYVASVGANLPLLAGIPMNGCGACFRLECSDTRLVSTPHAQLT